MPLIARLALGVGLVAVATGPAIALCSVEVAPVAFGIVDTQRESRGTGEVVVRCDTSTSYQVGISPGGAGGGSRRMTGPDGSRLEYRLFSDAGRSIPWGDGQGGGPPVSATSDGTGLQRLTIYGAIPAQPGIGPGEYTDSLQVTLTF
jgi:spore coat protein U-like protein